MILPDPFLICGLPRSRTAWLSVFLECSHELSGEVPTIDDMIDVLDRRERRGNSDSIQALFLSKILVRIPNANVVFVERNKDDAINSFVKVTGLKKEECTQLFDLIDAQISEWKKILPRSLTVKFEEIGDENVARAIWQHCRPMDAFNPIRFRALEKLNIQQKTDAINYAINHPKEFSISKILTRTTG